jgi:hypothetical protein
MIEHDFYGFGGSEAVGFSEIRFELVVKALDGSQRNLRPRLAERVNDFETTGGLSLRSVILDAA